MRGYVDTRWGQVHYSKAGKGVQVIALFHETPLNYAAFQRLVPLLAEDFTVYAFDSPGYGESDAPSAPTTIEEYASTIAEAMWTLGLAGVVAYGVHTGASLAFGLAALYPELVAALAVGGLPFYEDDVRQARQVPPVPDFADDGSHLTHVFEWEPAVYDAEMRSRLVSGVSKAGDRAYDAFHAVYAFQPTLHVRSLKCPVLVLSHAKDPVLSGDQRLVRELPSARQIVVESDRLPLYWTQPAIVAHELSTLAAEASGRA